MTSSRRGESGVIAVIAAVVATVLLMMAAFTVDFGMAFTTKRQLSTSADSASLAATAVYKVEFVGKCTSAALGSQAAVRANAEIAADAMFRANYPNGTNSDGNITAVRCKGSGVEVEYTASGTSDAAFGRLAGGNGRITTHGRASAAYLVTGRCSMCFLGPVDAGNADFSVTGGDIHVNGSINAGPNSEWNADNEISVVGTVNGGQFDPAATQGTIIPDPYASMVLPLSENGLSTTKTNPCTQGPGVYGAFQFPNSSCTLAAGAYVVKGLWDAKNNSVISGAGVTIYVKKTGKIDFKNGATQGLSAPTGPPAGAPAGWPSGFVIIYDRDNINDLGILGNGNISLKGIIYVPSSKIDFNGTSCLLVDTGAIVASGVVKANGNGGCVTITAGILAGPGVPGKLQLSQ